MSFNPVALGCKCESCPLWGSPPVAAEVPRDYRMIVVGEAPGVSETESGRPFYGESGRLLERVGGLCGYHRGDLLLTNAVACRMPERIPQKDLTKAINCCRPRLLHDLANPQSKVILALGKAALQALAKPSKKIFDWMGGPIESMETVSGFTVIPALHPAFCLREDGRQWLPVMMVHIQRAWSLTVGTLKPWEWPPYQLDVTKTALEYLHELAKPGGEVAFDVETQGKDPRTSKIIAIGLASEKLGVSLPWEAYFNRKLGNVGGILDEGNLGKRAKSLVEKILRSPSIRKVAHNGAFDTLSLQRMAGITVKNFSFDTLLAHTVVSPSLRHRLNDVECIYTHAPRHKDTFRAEKDKNVGARMANADPHDLRDYNVKDCFGTIFSKQGLVEHLERTHRGQEQLDALMARTRIATEMQDRGIPIDLARFDGHIHSIKRLRRYPLSLLRRIAFRLEVAHLKKQKEAAVWLRKGKERRAVTGLQPFQYAAMKLGIKLYNPGSHLQLSHLFADVLQAPTWKRSKLTGKPSYGETTMHELIAHPDPTISYVAGLHLRFRAWQKLLGYFLKRNINGVPVEGGMAHSTHKSWGTRTGRWSGPLLVIPKSGVLQIGKKKVKTPTLRDIFLPFPGNIIVEADYRALEAHIIALLAGDAGWLATLNKSGDVHAETAQSIFEGRYDKAVKVQRQLAKTINYAVQYCVGDDKLHATLQNVIPGISLADVMRIRKKVERPAIARYHKRALNDAYRLDYIEDVLSGLRYTFYGKVKPTYVANNPVQTFAASLINRAIIGVRKDLDWPTEGIMIQCHDALIVDGPNPKRIAGILKKHMEQTITLNGFTANFLIDVSVGKNWGEMEKMK